MAQEMLLQLLKECDCMKKYYKLLLEKLLDIYERRESFAKDNNEIRVIQIEPAKEYKEYIDRYNHEAYRDINVAIEKLEQQKIVYTIHDVSGKYTKVKLNLEAIKDAYAFAGRMSIPELCDKMKMVLERYQSHNNAIICKVIKDFTKQLEEYKKLPYDINFDDRKLDLVLLTLSSVVNLDQETYIRNLSTAVFRDSKKFQKLRPIIESILFDYTDVVVEKERILEVYNLFDNPTYVLIKGNTTLTYKNSNIDLTDMNGGIAIPNSALGDIIRIKVNADKIITVENLTTYHDSEDGDSMFIYLGGFHNLSKQQFLNLLFSQNQEKEYCHKGDLDVYGFSILENLKNKTGIPFQPLEMDIDTLERYYNCGLYKELTANDRKAMKSERLQKYSAVFEFMLKHNCKVEQESIKALELIENI
jgi:hypothetical protein